MDINNFDLALSDGNLDDFKRIYERDKDTEQNWDELAWRCIAHNKFEEALIVIPRVDSFAYKDRKHKLDILHLLLLPYIELTTEESVILIRVILEKDPDVLIQQSKYCSNICSTASKIAYSGGKRDYYPLLVEMLKFSPWSEDTYGLPPKEFKNPSINAYTDYYVFKSVVVKAWKESRKDRDNAIDDLETAIWRGDLKDFKRIYKRDKDTEQDWDELAWKAVVNNKYAEALVLIGRAKSFTYSNEQDENILHMLGYDYLDFSEDDGAELVRRIIKKQPHLVAAKTKTGFTPLYHIAINSVVSSRTQQYYAMLVEMLKVSPWDEETCGLPENELERFEGFTVKSFPDGKEVLVKAWNEAHPAKK